MSTNQDLMKSLSAAVDVAVAELMALNNLNKGEVNLQEAKIGQVDPNGQLAGEGTRGESVLNPGENAKKAEKEPDEDDEKDEKKEDKKDKKPEAHKEPDEDDEDDMDDDKAEKMEQKLCAYKAKKEAGMKKSEVNAQAIAESLKKSITAPIEEFQKSVNDRMARIEELIKKIGSAPAARQSLSGLTPLVKSAEDNQAPGSQLSKSQILDKLFDLQKSGDRRVSSEVIARVETGDMAVLAERDIKLT